MLCLPRTILLSVSLIVLFTTVVVSQKPDELGGCKNQLVYPNAELDNYHLPNHGAIERIEIRETDLQDDEISDLIETENFNESGNITDTFFTNSKIKVFGKQVYSYDPQIRLTLKVSYNPDGSAVLEDVFKYDLGGNLQQVITRNAKSKVVIWNKQFSYNHTQGYSELIDKGHDYGFKFKKDSRCRIVELTSHKSDRTITSKVVVIYDDKNSLAEESAYTPSGNLISKKKYEFEFDKNGNWIKKIISNLTAKNGKMVYIPEKAVNRTIRYFEKK